MSGLELEPEVLTPRLKKLKDDLLQAMPIKKSADRETLSTKTLGNVLIQYLTYNARLVRPRPRRVVIWPEVKESQDYAIYEEAIDRIASALRQGDDINAYLSNQVKINVYSGNLPSTSAGMTNEEWLRKAWKGKDRVRVTLDTHHFHLGAVQVDGTVARTGPLLFAGITANEAFLLTIGNHASFDDGKVSRLMYDKFEASLVQAGGGASLFPTMGVTLGGTQVKDTFRSIDLIKRLRAIDERLTSEGFADATQRIFHIEWDDLLVLDAGTGAVLSREPGGL